ncbi:MAG: PhoPQ-activated protein PqaA family protein [Pirellulales bacterium]|nr:PhoPQ-activated protein PqaA family protein [Pirellulales bacterium]
MLDLYKLTLRCGKTMLTCLALSPASLVWSQTAAAPAALPVGTSPAPAVTAPASLPSTAVPVAGVKEAAPHPSQALADYIARPDESFSWKIRRKFDLPKGRGVELIMTSQTWKDIPWKHQLYLYIPQTASTKNHALFLVDGGAWKAEYEAPAENNDISVGGRTAHLLEAANVIKAPLVILRQVPQQPIFDGKVEDEIISLTFEKYMKTGQADWPLLLPMVKSVVRAMDTVQKVAQEEWQQNIDKFVVTGASKRGWTTWLTGAVEPRAVAIAPMVIDMLNLSPQMEQQLAYYGEYSEQIKDYTEKSLPKMLKTPRGRQLQQIIDPFAYKEKITQPKLIILGTNDRYWTVDALNLYYDELAGETNILYVPNNGHDIQDMPRLIGTLAAFYEQAAGGVTLPKLTWKYSNGEQGLQLQVGSEPLPQKLTLWTATNKTRDFRNAQFTPTTIDNVSGLTTIKLPPPDAGYSVNYVEATYDRQPFPCTLSTTMRVQGQE